MKKMLIVVHLQLEKYIDENIFLMEEQSGCRQKHSCESALNLVIADWKEKLHDKKEIVAMFLDLKRAFETEKYY